MACHASAGYRLNTPVDVFCTRMPRHSFATDDLTHGLHLYTAAEALRRAILQFNAKHSVSWLAYDVDRETAAYDYEDLHAPTPNLVIVNPENGHGHLLYGLEAPIHNYLEAKPAPQRFLAAVDVALCEKLEADPGYSRLLCKNPTHPRWIVLTPRLPLYDLQELSDWVDLSKYRDRRRRLPTSGLGRNCTLFESLRLWAYRERRQPWLSETMFYQSVLAYAHELNAGFTPPLPHSEVRATARSVSRWTWRRMSSEGFQKLQADRSRRAVIRHTTIKLERYARIRETVDQCPDLTQEDIAALAGVSRSTVIRALQGTGTKPHSCGNVSKPISDKEGV